MKIFTRISAATLTSLVLIGGMSLGAQADSPPVKNGTPITVGDVKVTVDGPWRYQDGSAMEATACTLKSATDAHHVSVGDFTVTTSSGQSLAAQMLDPSARSFPAEVDVTPGQCVTGFLTVPEATPDSVTAISFGEGSWKPFTPHTTASLDELARTDDGLTVQVTNLRSRSDGIWIAELNATSATPVTFRADWISFVAGGKTNPIYNHEGDILDGKGVPAETRLGVYTQLSREFSFYSPDRPTSITVNGVTFTIPPAKSGSTTTTSLGETAVTKSGMSVKVSNLRRGDFELWVADITITAKAPAHVSRQMIGFVADGKASPAFNYEGPALPGTIPLDSDLAAGKSVSGQISFASDSRPTAITFDGVTFTVPAAGEGQPGKSTPPNKPGLPKTGN